MVPSASRSQDDLWNWLRNGISVKNSPLDRLPTDGQSLLYSSLRPETAKAVLRITTMSYRWFLILIVGGGVVLGAALVRSAVRTRAVVSVTLIAGVALAGVFLPSLAHALINDATAAGAMVVLLVWGVYDLFVRLPELRKSLPPKPESHHSRPLRPGAAKRMAMKKRQAEKDPVEIEEPDASPDSDEAEKKEDDDA
jgi:hypothetical protein